MSRRTTDEVTVVERFTRTESGKLRRWRRRRDYGVLMGVAVLLLIVGFLCVTVWGVWCWARDWHDGLGIR